MRYGYERTSRSILLEIEEGARFADAIGLGSSLTEWGLHRFEIRNGESRVRVRPAPLFQQGPRPFGLGVLVVLFTTERVMALALDLAPETLGSAELRVRRIGEAAFSLATAGDIEADVLPRAAEAFARICRDDSSPYERISFIDKAQRGPAETKALLAQVVCMSDVRWPWFSYSRVLGGRKLEEWWADAPEKLTGDFARWVYQSWEPPPPKPEGVIQPVQEEPCY